MENGCVTPFVGVLLGNKAICWVVGGVGSCVASIKGKRRQITDALKTKDTIRIVFAYGDL